MDNFWPVSIFLPRLPQWQDLITLLAILLFGLVIVAFWHTKHYAFTLLSAVMLVIATNLLQGVNDGFIYPVTGRAPSDRVYMQEALKVGNVGEYLRNYTSLQPFMGDHSRVHPPGTVLFYFFIGKVVSQPLVVSLSISLLGSITAYLILHLSRRTLADMYARFTSILFLLIPAIQIYFIANFDAVFCTFVFITYYFWQKNAKLLYLVLTAVFFLLAAFTNFAALWLVPVLFALEWLRTRSFKRTVMVITLIGAGFGLLWLTTGYNYGESMLIGKMYEGSQGFYLISDPLSYFVTRIENIIMILLFLGPYASFILIKSLLKPSHEYQKVGLVAVISLLMFFMAGAYYTGETARAALYIYPFLILPIGAYLAGMHASQRLLTFFLTVSLLQSVVMQLFGFYD